MLLCRLEQRQQLLLNTQIINNEMPLLWPSRLGRGMDLERDEATRHVHTPSHDSLCTTTDFMIMHYHYYYSLLNFGTYVIICDGDVLRYVILSIYLLITMLQLSWRGGTVVTRLQYLNFH